MPICFKGLVPCSLGRVQEFRYVYIHITVVFLKMPLNPNSFISPDQILCKLHWAQGYNSI